MFSRKLILRTNVEAWKTDGIKLRVSEWIETKRFLLISRLLIPSFRFKFFDRDSFS